MAKDAQGGSRLVACTLLLLALCSSVRLLAFSGASGRHSSRALTATARAAKAWNAEVSRKQALLSAALVAPGASKVEAEELNAKVKSLMKEDPMPNDNGAPEKHIPKAYPGGGSVDVVVQHVMDKDKPHYIQYMRLTATLPV